MNPALKQLLIMLRLQGVELRVEGDHLCWRPRDAIPPEMVAFLRQHKQSLMTLLTGPTGPTGPGGPAVAGAHPSGVPEPNRAPCGPVEAAGLTFPLTLQDELLLEKSSLREQIEQWPDPDQRQRLLELEQEQPATLTEAVAWLRRVWQVVSRETAAPRSAPAPARPPAPPAAPSPAPEEQVSVSAAAWDRAEAERVLEQLRADLSRIERDQHRGKFHPVLARVLADGVAVAESFIANHEREAAADWDALKLLRDCARRLVRTARLEEWKGHVLPWEPEKPA